MRTRCYYNGEKDNKNYKTKGISICQDWLYNFDNFYEWAINNGHQPEFVIDRIDPTGNYTPMNYQWISRSENSRRQHSDSFYRNGCHI
jgi:hypothetical protein